MIACEFLNQGSQALDIIQIVNVGGYSVVEHPYLSLKFRSVLHFVNAQVFKQRLENRIHGRISFEHTERTDKLLCFRHLSESHVLYGALIRTLRKHAYSTILNTLPPKGKKKKKKKKNETFQIAKRF